MDARRAPLGKFGKFGMQDPADFVGCCNPINVATTPDGKVVTSEKMVARVKVFEPDGRLLAVIGTEHFDPMCTQIHLASTRRGGSSRPIPCGAGSRCSRPLRRAERASAVMSERSTRRQFIDRSCRLVAT